MTSTSPLADGVAEAVSRLALRGTTLMVLVVDADERVVRANPALTRACGAELKGAPLASLLTPASLDALRGHVESQAEQALLLQFVPSHAEPFSVYGFVQRQAAGFALAAEPPWEDHRALEARLQSLNAELAELSRTRAREARQLEQALAELRDTHWHLKKISDVLPICVECRAVQTAPSTWEDLSDFLVRKADFLSHGYCARCASRLTLDLDAAKGDE